METKIDKLGNLLDERKAEDLSTICGSHLDTVKNGGLYDGLVGIVSAMEAIAYLKDNNIVTRHPITVVAFNGEEGSELGGTFGSRAIMGLVNLKDPKLKNKLSRYNLAIEDLESSLIQTEDIKCFLELHVEQSKKLDREKISIGIVEGIVAIYRYNITINGEANHSGTTLMKDRKDALLQASKIISIIDEIANSINDEIVITVGKMDIFPGAINVIPGKVRFIIEIRDIEEENIEKAINMIVNKLKGNENFKYEIETICLKPAVLLDDNIKNIIESKCKSRKMEYCRMNSRAGHDSKPFSSKVPTGMIFIPSKGGKSHCPDEYTDGKDIENGIKILIDTILELDKD